MKTIGTITRREIRSFFQSPIAYAVVALFLLVSAAFFFPTFFIFDRAELRGFFQLLPILLAIIIPMTTMRLLSEEYRSGTLETLITLPATTRQIVLGKYFATLVFILAMLLPSLLFLLLILPAGSPDPRPVIGGYLGAFFLAAAYSSIGLFASAHSKNQIVSFVTGFLICISLAIIDQFLIFLPPVVLAPIEALSIGYHFDTIARGLIDTRGIVYFLSLTVVGLIGAVRALEAKR